MTLIRVMYSNHHPTTQPPEIKYLASLIHDPMSDPEASFPNPKVVRQGSLSGIFCRFLQPDPFSSAGSFNALMEFRYLPVFAGSKPTGRLET